MFSVGRSFRNTRPVIRLVRYMQTAHTPPGYLHSHFDLPLSDPCEHYLRYQARDLSQLNQVIRARIKFAPCSWCKPDPITLGAPKRRCMPTHCDGRPKKDD